MYKYILNLSRLIATLAFLFVLMPVSGYADADNGKIKILKDDSLPNDVVNTIPLPERPELPEKPDRPEIPERPELPERPDIPDRPDVPDRPELPDLPDRAGRG